MTTLNYSLSHALVREMKEGDEIVITQLEHEANRGPWLALRERGITVREVGDAAGRHARSEDLAGKVTERTRLVGMVIASNALGTVTDVALARRLAREAGAWLLLDAVHYAAHLPLDVQALDADFLLCSAYKFYGPHVGILYARPGLLASLSPERLRTQEEEAPWRFEMGTLNHAALAGVKAAIEYIAAWGDGATLRERIVSAMTAIAAYEHGLGTYYRQRGADIPGVTVWGPDFSGPAGAHDLHHHRRRPPPGSRPPAGREGPPGLGRPLLRPAAHRGVGPGGEGGGNSHGDRRCTTPGRRSIGCWRRWRKSRARVPAPPVPPPPAPPA